MWSWETARDCLPHLLRGLAVTVECVAAGMAIALVVGLAFAMARRSPRRAVAWPAGALVEFVRSTPLLVQLYFLYFLLPGTFSVFAIGALALGLHYSTYTSEVYRSGIEAVPRGQWEAARALDLTAGQTWRHVVLPQAIPPVIPALGNYLVAMFKDTPLLLAVNVLEVLRQAQLYGNVHFTYLEPYTIVGAMYLALSLLSSRLVHRLEVRYGTVAPGGA